MIMGGKGSGRPRNEKGNLLHTITSEPEKGDSVVETLPNNPDAEKDRVREGLEQVGAEYHGETEERKPRRSHKARRDRDAERAAADAAEAEKLEKRKAEVAGDFAMLGTVVLTIVCERLPNPVPPTPAETQVFSNAVSAMVRKYYPQLETYGPEIALAVACGVVIVPRLKAPKGKAAPVIVLPQGDAPKVPDTDTVAPAQQTVTVG